MLNYSIHITEYYSFLFFKVFLNLHFLFLFYFFCVFIFLINFLLKKDMEKSVQIKIIQAEVFSQSKCSKHSS